MRVAVASTPLTASLEEAVPAAIAAIDEAARQGAAIVCLPEACVPGHRGQARAVADLGAEALAGALRSVGEAAGRAGVVAIVGAERVAAGGREIVSVVFGADGAELGVQAKTQIDPSEEPDYVFGSGRSVFSAAGATFGIVICHEGFRYPEIARSLVLAGARILFAPHYVTSDDGSLPVRWCAADNPYNEKALLLRALENSVFVAASNVAGPDQGSLSAIIGPDGALLASVPYGEVGVASAELDLSLADRRLALRWAPERSVIG
jgi:predicted amidohydrolase